MICRICGCKTVQVVGTYKPYLDYECSIYDCKSCGCRFAPYDESIYEKLHRSTGSTYDSHDKLAMKAEHLFKRKDIEGLKKYLIKVPKYKFIIDTIEKHSVINKIVEVGCSKGYLTAYFILKGFDVKGMDISPTAIQDANRRFGHNFVLSNDPAIEKNAPYDAIYHVGTIGCVKSPRDFTKYLLTLLKPNGLLLFNSPNVCACLETGRAWVSGTPPPDLVTLFKEEFWKNNFVETADVTIHKEPNEPYYDALIYIKNIFGGSKDHGAKRTLFEHRGLTRMSFLQKILLISKSASFLFLRVFSLLLSFMKVLPTYTSEFGMYVVMIKK